MLQKTKDFLSKFYEINKDKNINVNDTILKKSIDALYSELGNSIELKNNIETYYTSNGQKEYHCIHGKVYLTKNNYETFELLVANTPNSKFLKAGKIKFYDTSDFFIKKDKYLEVSKFIEIMKEMQKKLQIKEKINEIIENTKTIISKQLKDYKIKFEYVPKDYDLIEMAVFVGNIILKNMEVNKNEITEAQKKTLSEYKIELNDPTIKIKYLKNGDLVVEEDDLYRVLIIKPNGKINYKLQDLFYDKVTFNIKFALNNTISDYISFEEFEKKELIQIKKDIEYMGQKINNILKNIAQKNGLNFQNKQERDIEITTIIRGKTEKQMINAKIPISEIKEDLNLILQKMGEKENLNNTEILTTNLN